MKKIVVFFTLCLTLYFSSVPQVVNASSGSSYEEVTATQANDILTDFVTSHPKRTVGTEGSLLAAEYIANIFFDYGLQTYYSKEQVDFSLSFEEQSSKYYETVSSIDFTSNSVVDNNVIGFKEARIETNDTVVIGAHYDNVASVLVNGSEIGGQGAYDNGTGVSTMLAIANNVIKTDFDFNIVFVAFAAEENGLNGSQRFVNNMETNRKDHFDNLILMYNLDVVGGGDYLYLYSDEVSTEHETFSLQIASEIGVSIKENPVNKRSILYGNAYDGYSYSHIGMMSDHASFYNKGKNVVFMFGSNWNTTSKNGIVESEVYDAIMHTSNDTLEKLEENYKEQYKQFMANSANLILASLSSNDFVSVMKSSNENKNSFAFLKSTVWISIIGFAIVVGVSIFIIYVYYKEKKVAKPIVYNMPNLSDILKQQLPPNENNIFWSNDEQDKPEDPFGF